MSCALTTGYNIGCAATAGIRQIFIAGYDDVLTIVRSGNIVASITMKSGKKFYRYQVRAASFTESHEVKENGQIVNSQTASFAVNSLTSVMRAEISRMAKLPLLLIIQDRVGVYWLMGELYGGRLIKIESGLGSTGSDRRGMVLSFSSEQLSFAPIVASVAGITEAEIGDDCVFVDSDGIAFSDSDDIDMVDGECGGGDFLKSDFSSIDFL